MRDETLLSEEIDRLTRENEELRQELARRSAAWTRVDAILRWRVLPVVGVIVLAGALGLALWFKHEQLQRELVLGRAEQTAWLDDCDRLCRAYDSTWTATVPPSVASTWVSCVCSTTTPKETVEALAPKFVLTATTGLDAFVTEPIGVCATFQPQCTRRDSVRNARYRDAIRLWIDQTH